MKYRFVDMANIHVIAGRGGDGCASMRRDKFEEFGGPDGGDGGQGGSIIIKASRHVSTLFYYSYRRIHRAKNGKNGSSAIKHGANGDDLILLVPLWTQVSFFNQEGEYEDIVALAEDGDKVVVAVGGDGGLGNCHFKSSVNRRPYQFTRGRPGEESILRLTLKTIADVGIIGQPNCGKSTFITKVSEVRSKVADYAFTTVRPHVGVIRDEMHSHIIADIPGLIKGASEGAGLGHEFLRHVEKCKILLHVIDGSIDNSAKVYKDTRKELEVYDNIHGSHISQKPELILLNKTDLIAKEDVRKKVKSLSKFATVISVSLINHDGLDNALHAINQQLNQMTDKSTAFAPKSGY